MGRQFANDAATPDPISVSRDGHKNEIPSDRPYHDDTTPGHSNSLYVGRQFDTIVKEGTGYGVSVTDKGQSPSREVTSVDVHGADRGKDA